MGPPYHRPASVRRPFSSATAALRRASPGRGRHGGEFLAELLDFEGAVQLAQTLDAPPAGPQGEVASPDQAVARAQRRLAEVEREARLPLHDPHTGAPLVTAERIARVLARAGVPASRPRKAIDGAARELFGALEARTLQRIGSVRRVVAELRRELGPAIAASGPQAARLEQIDAALTVATAARESALVARAVGAVGDAFAADLERAVLALPKPCEELPVEAWAGEGGFVAEHVGRCESLALAAFVHERARVDMLVGNTLGGRLG